MSPVCKLEEFQLLTEVRSFNKRKLDITNLYDRLLENLTKRYTFNLVDRLLTVSCDLTSPAKFFLLNMLIILCGPAMSWSLHNGSRIFLRRHNSMVQWSMIVCSPINYTAQKLLGRSPSINTAKVKRKPYTKKWTYLFTFLPKNALEAFSLLYNSDTIFSILTTFLSLNV